MDAGPVFVPFTLPGETVSAELHGDRATALAIVNRSSERVEPPCPHFGACGGCSLQHWEPTAYREWKRQQVVAAFAQRGLEPPVAEIISCAPASRRRAVFTAERDGKRIVLGFNQAGSHEVVATPECRVLVPAIANKLEAIATLMAPLVQPRRRARVAVIAADNGLDIAIDDLGRVEDRALDTLPGRISDPAIARVTIAGETIYLARDPELTAGPATLLPTPAGFIQAVASAETTIAKAVLAAIGPAKRVADLFCGIGTFSLRLAELSRVTAIDGDVASVAALERAARHVQGLKRVKSVRRDLLADPLSAHELKMFDAVVFDPPRAGARAQAEQLASSTVPVVVAVSCNPATLARDARILVDGGYRLVSVQPIDQFLWSAHIEAVTAFER
jgi:23S rRNA (uracil1939-C5)-methyltransferase